MGVFRTPPPVFTGGAQPYGSRQLTPPGSAPPAADDPAFGQATRLEREFWALRLAWEPAVPLAQGRRSFVHALAVAADNPPFRAPDQLRIVHAAWQPRPWVFEQTLIVQGVPVDNPPFSGRDAQRAVFSWNVGTTSIRAQRYVPQVAAAAADAPPFSDRDPYGALRAWQITPPPHERGRSVVQEFVQAVDNPPFNARDLLNPLISAWRTEWRPIQGQRYQVQPGAVIAADDPPFSGRRVMHPALQGWQTEWRPGQGQKFLAQGEIIAADAPPPRPQRAPLAVLAWDLEVPRFYPPAPLVQPYVAPEDPPFSGRKPLNAVAHWQPPWPEVVYLHKQTVDNPPMGDPTPPATRVVAVYGPGVVVVYGPNRVTFDV